MVETTGAQGTCKTGVTISLNGFDAAFTKLLWPLVSISAGDCLGNNSCQNCGKLRKATITYGTQFQFLS